MDGEFLKKGKGNRREEERGGEGKREESESSCLCGSASEGSTGKPLLVLGLPLTEV